MTMYIFDVAMFKIRTNDHCSEIRLFTLHGKPHTHGLYHFWLRIYLARASQVPNYLKPYLKGEFLNIRTAPILLV